VTAQRILVVDDDRKFLHFVTELLTGAGYEVHSTSDALKAVAMAREVMPSVAILDISMPKLDGLELARQLHDDPWTEKIRCMFLTARSPSEGLKPAQDAGGRAYLQKPVQSSKLLWLLKTLLSEEPPKSKRSPRR